MKRSLRRGDSLSRQFHGCRNMEGKTYNKKVHLWFIGILCYELLVGNPPFKTTSCTETCKWILKVDVRFPHQCLLKLGLDFQAAQIQALWAAALGPDPGAPLGPGALPEDAGSLCSHDFLSPVCSILCVYSESLPVLLPHLLSLLRCLMLINKSWNILCCGGRGEKPHDCFLPVL